jgi:PKD repeat protein
MKTSIIIFLFLIVASAESQWTSIGNADKLATYKFNFKNFVISEDNKYIYTQDANDVIMKWDYNNGDSIWSKKIIPDSTLAHTYSGLFLSSDAKTYCTVYDVFWSFVYYRLYIYIFDLSSHTLIDSLIIPLKFDDSQYCGYSPISNCLDYNYHKKTLISSINYNYGCTGPWYTDLQSGIVHICTRNDTIWKIQELKNGKTNLTVNNLNNDLRFFHFTSDYSYSIGHTTPHSTASETNSNYYYNFNNDKLIQMTYYEHSIDDDYNGGRTESTKGKSYPFCSMFFENNDSNIFLSLKDTIFKFNLKKNDFIQIQALSQYPTDKPLQISSTADSNYFFTITGNKLNAHTLDGFRYCNSFAVDKIDSILFLKNSADSEYVLIIDTRGGIYRIKNEDIFALNANFFTQDTIVNQGDSVMFYDCSLGYPDDYLWDFGDGKISNEVNPTHTYSDTGYYSIRLIVSKNGVQDTVIKDKLVLVLQKLQSDFDYKITGSFPLKVNFTNKSAGVIDSLIWTFGDNTTSKLKNPVHDYYISSKYDITLKIFSKTLISLSSKTITINVTEPNLDNNKFSYEFTDTIHQDGIAIKGYEEKDNYLVFHIAKDSMFYHGAYKNSNIKWEETAYTSKNYLVRRKNGKYAYFYESNLYNLDKDGNWSDFHGHTNANSLYSVKAIDNHIITTYINSIQYTLDELNEVNTKIYSKYLREFDWYLGDNPKLTVYDFIAYKDSIRIDYSLSSYFRAISYQNGQYFSKSTFDINNNRTFPFMIINDFIRLNDSILVFAYKDGLMILKNYGIMIDTSKHVPSKWDIILKNKLDGFSFYSLLKLNDTSFVAAGSCNNSPAYIISNNSGNIIDSVSMNDRFGEFKFVSLTPDNNLLLSGYRNKYYEYKSPYFVKTDNPLVRLLSNYQGNPQDTTKQDSSKNQILAYHKCYPNPTNDIAKILFFLFQKATVKIKLFDMFGGLAFSYESKEYENGTNEIEIDFSPFSSGYYFYRLEVNGIIYPGAITFYR